MVPESNKALIRRLYQRIDQGDLPVLQDFFHADYVDHAFSLMAGSPGGLDGLEKRVEVIRSAAPDTRHTIEDLLAEGDKVVARITGRGTHTGPLFGQPPTGAMLTMSGIAIYRIHDGRIVERWSEADHLGLLQQLGIVKSLTSRYGGEGN